MPHISKQYIHYARRKQSKTNYMQLITDSTAHFGKIYQIYHKRNICAAQLVQTGLPNDQKVQINILGG